MKISIDTAQDSKDEIRKAIRLLQALVEHNSSEGSRNIFDDSGPGLLGSAGAPDERQSEPSGSASAFADMFGSDSPAPEQGKKETNSEVPEVELY